MRTALVTGAGIRVGRAIALRLAGAGYRLILHANRSHGRLEEVAAEARAAGAEVFLHRADLSDPAEVDRMAEAVAAAHPILDLVVHNAGIYEAIPFGRIDRPAWRRMQAINLEAPFFLTQGLLPALHAAASPHVVHLGDIGGERPVPGFAHYSVSKAGLLMLTRALAVELAPRVRVNAVSPGTVAFPEGLDPQARQELVARIPLQREGSPDDIAKAVLYLDRDAPYVSGQVLAVDGGRSAVL